MGQASVRLRSAWLDPFICPTLRATLNYLQGDGGTGAVVFRQGEGGTGAVVLAINQGDGGTGAVVLASVEWVVKAFRPMALVTTSRARTSNISHLFMDPSEWETTRRSL
jgi:hypothetical protein